MDLNALQQRLAEDGLIAVLLPPDEEIDTERINVALSVDGFGTPLVLQISPIELTNGDLHACEMVQIFVPIPVPFTPDQTETILTLLNGINQLTPLIGFFLETDDMFAYFRHVLLLPSDSPAIAFDLSLQAVWLAYFAVDIYAAQIVALATPSG